MFEKKIRCIYCGKKIKAAAECPICERKLQPMVPIETLNFTVIPAEDLAMLRAKKPGFLEKKIHAEMLAAADEGRLRIAEAVADGIYFEDGGSDDVDIDKSQLIRTPDGSPIEGKFSEGLYFHVVEELDIEEEYMEDEPFDEEEYMEDEPFDEEEDYEPIDLTDVDECRLHVLRYENKKGKVHYTLINAEDMARLGEKLCEVEIPLYQMDQYEENRFR